MSKLFQFKKEHIEVLKKFINVYPSLGFYKNHISVWNNKEAISARLNFETQNEYPFDALGLKEANRLLKIIDYCGENYSVKLLNSQFGDKNFALNVFSDKNSFKYILHTINDGTGVIPECQFDVINEKFDIIKDKKTTSFKITWEQLNEIFEIKKIVGTKYFIFSLCEDEIKTTIGRIENDTTCDSAEVFIKNTVEKKNWSKPVKFCVDSSILVEEDYEIEYSEKLMKMTSQKSGVVYFIFANIMKESN